MQMDSISSSKVKSVKQQEVIMNQRNVDNQQQKTEDVHLRSRKRYRLKSQDIISQRFQCFCAKQYLSYCALLGHLKKKHCDFFKDNAKTVFGNIIDTLDPIYGFKIKKLLTQNVQLHSEQKKKIPSNKFQKIIKVQPLSQLRQNDNIKLQENNENKQLQNKLNECITQNIELKNRLVSFDRKRQKMQQIASQMKQIIKAYQNIFCLLKIEPITDQIDIHAKMEAKAKQQKKQQKDDDESYVPE